MKFKVPTADDINYFKNLLSDQQVLTDNENREKNSRDHTEDISHLPDIVLLPENTEQVSKILKYCNEQNICITARGAGTGLSGGSIPLKGGISLDFRKMNKIIEIDKANYQVTVEPGVITEVLQEALEQDGLFYPVDPASRGSCFIGGNVSENSGGPRAVKYGTVKDYVLNLEVVLANGEIIQTGANTLKNATGYDLTRLIVGSEGTLAIITKIVLKLIPYPKERLLLLAPFDNINNAINAVNAVLQTGIIPSTLEFMERDALVYTEKYLGESPIKIPDHIEAHVLIEVDGNDKDAIFKQVEVITEALSVLTKEEIFFAESAEQQEALWKLRRSVGIAVKSSSVYKEEDTVVPRSYLPELLKFVKTTGEKYGFYSICYGHIGDGNMHVNILKESMSDEAWKNDLPFALKEIFQFVKSVGGTISGEHGIGLVQKEFMPIVFHPSTLQIMKNIKGLFDPKGILNPGKIFPDD